MPSSHSRPTGLAECTTTSTGQKSFSQHQSTTGLVVSSPPRSWSRDILIGDTFQFFATFSAKIASYDVLNQRQLLSGGVRMSSTQIFMMPPIDRAGRLRRDCHRVLR